MPSDLDPETVKACATCGGSTRLYLGMGIGGVSIDAPCPRCIAREVFAEMTAPPVPVPSPKAPPPDGLREAIEAAVIRLGDVNPSWFRSGDSRRLTDFIVAVKAAIAARAPVDERDARIEQLTAEARGYCVRIATLESDAHERGERIEELERERARIDGLEQQWIDQCARLRAYVDEHSLGHGGERIDELVLRDARTMRARIAELEGIIAAAHDSATHDHAEIRAKREHIAELEKERDAYVCETVEDIQCRGTFVECCAHMLPLLDRRGSAAGVRVARADGDPLSLDEQAVASALGDRIANLEADAHEHRRRIAELERERDALRENLDPLVAERLEQNVRIATLEAQKARAWELGTALGNAVYGMIHWFDGGGDFGESKHHIERMRRELRAWRETPRTISTIYNDRGVCIHYSSGGASAPAWDGHEAPAQNRQPVEPPSDPDAGTTRREPPETALTGGSTAAVTCPGCNGSGYQSAGDDRIGTWPCTLCHGRATDDETKGGASCPLPANSGSGEPGDAGRREDSDPIAAATAAVVEAARRVAPRRNRAGITIVDGWRALLDALRALDVATFARPQRLTATTTVSAAGCSVEYAHGETRRFVLPRTLLDIPRADAGRWAALAIRGGSVRVIVTEEVDDAAKSD